jgi:hypothetical protein
MKYYYLSLAFFLFVSGAAFAQEELLDEPVQNEKVIATFKTTRIVNAHSIETVKKRTLDFRITHHFGDIAGDGGGGHTLWGLDQAADIRFGFEYGITDRFTLGFGRSKINELLDGYLKFRLLQQTTSNSVPLSLTVFANTGFTPAKNTNEIFDKVANRFSYTYQLLIARKFSRKFSFQLVPSFVHRNLVFGKDENDLFSIGAGGRFKVTKRFALLADYFYTFSDFRKDNDLFHAPLGVGIEIETGGHVFHVFFTNNAAIVENNFIPNTTSSWEEGEFKLGFNISRVFTF